MIRPCGVAAALREIKEKVEKYYHLMMQSAVQCSVMYCMALFDALLWCMVHTCVYYRSRIESLLFMPKIQLKRVYGMVKNGAHTIVKIKKSKVPQIFYFFSMVWVWRAMSNP